MRQLKIATQITNRDSQAVEAFKEISKIGMITPEEETILAQKLEMGDQRALGTANAFVVSVAKQYQHQGLSLSDLINEGNLGLIKAAQRFTNKKDLSLFRTLFGGSGVYLTSVGRAGQISPPAPKQKLALTTRQKQSLHGF